MNAITHHHQSPLVLLSLDLSVSLVSGPLPKTRRTLRWTLTWTSGASSISPSQFHTLVLGIFFSPSLGSAVKLWLNEFSGWLLINVSYKTCRRYSIQIPELPHPLHLYEGQLEGVVPLKGHSYEVPEVVKPGPKLHSLLPILVK